MADALRPGLDAALKELANCDLNTSVPLVLMTVLDIVGDNTVLKETARANAEHIIRLRNGNDARHAESVVAAVFGPRPKAKAARVPTPSAAAAALPVGVISYEDTEPATDAVDLYDLLTDIADFITERVHLPDDAMVTTALWIVHT